MTPARFLFVFIILCSITLFSAFSGCLSEKNVNESEGGLITVTDLAGRTVAVPENPERVAVSGSGSMRYFAYLQVTDRVVAVDYQESSALARPNETRPYMLAVPQIKDNPILGTAKGAVDAERLLKADPDILFISGAGADAIEKADEIQAKTGIPVVVFYSGDYVVNADKVDSSLRLIGKILDAETRAEAVISFFAETRRDLEARTAGLDPASKPVVYAGGISYNGAHGLDGTDPRYLPFTVLHARNAAAELAGREAATSTGYAQTSKEKILEWDPDYIFVDLGTTSAAGGGAIVELKTDSSYAALSAVRAGRVYAVNPHTSMGTNHETTLANAYFIGTILYPEQFSDIDPGKKADDIYSFIVGKPVYSQLKENMGGLSYTKLDI